MSNGTDEIAEIRKRLEAIERAIDELRAGNVALMQITAAIGRTIRGPETTETVIGTGDKFVKNITDHAKTEKIESAGKALEKVANAEDAMAVANAFMKKDNSVALPLKAVRRDEVWVVDVDIGAVRMEIVRVKIDAKTGGILGHETVEKK
jgi:uncharacterized coiled-coil DUF342 family protein